jgi:DNA repair exonuclease SbcCD nuclease subunit
LWSAAERGAIPASEASGDVSLLRSAFSPSAKNLGKTARSSTVPSHSAPGFLYTTIVIPHEEFALRIAFISDTHFGLDWDGPTRDDSFRQAAEALDRAGDMADVIVMPGDIFDNRVPKPEVLDRAIKTLSIPMRKRSSGVRAERFVDKQAADVMPHAFSGVPIIAIHGTHERRAGELANPVKMMESAGLLVYLHCNAIVLEKAGERVAIAGLSGVPEPYVLDVLRQAKFNPVDGCFNVFVLHQNFKEYIHEDASFLSVEDLPLGYDLYVNGHIHWHDYSEKKGRRFLLPGSTVTTQLRKGESEQQKCFVIYDTATRKLEWVELKTQRPAFYKAFDFKDADAATVVRETRSWLESVVANHFELKPLIRVKLTGSLATGAVLEPADIISGFDAFVSVDDELAAGSFKKKISMLRELQARKSIDEIGQELLKKNLSEAGFAGANAEELLALLEDNDQDKLMKLLGIHAPGTRQPVSRNSS